MAPSHLIKPPRDDQRTGLVIPTTKENFFNTQLGKREPPCAYDMLFHPPDFDPKSARSDRQDPNIIKRNIWEQEFHKPISSTSHFMYGRPKWKPADWPTKEHVKIVVKNQNPHMRIYTVLEWAVLIDEGKPNPCVQ